MNAITNSLLFSEASAIQSICEPLKLLEITGFFFFRNYKDQSMIDFATDMDWTAFFFNKLFNHGYEKLDVVDHHYLESRVSLWEMNPQNLVWQDGKEHFGVGNGVSLITDLTEDYVEVCCFYTNKNNHHLNEFYLNNLDLLLNFSHYFKDKSSSLIKKFERTKITLPDFYSDKIPTPTHSLEEKYKAFISAIKPKRFHFDKTYLTFREAECLNWLSQGKTAEETAIILSTSKRTVQTHIENIKNKLGRHTKADLIDFAIKSGIINFFKP